MKKKICFIAQFPPPIHGLSKAVDTLYNSKLSEEFDFSRINITNNKRIILNIISIIKSKSDLYYFTISQSRIGNLRDLIILWILRNSHCLIHLHGGYYRNMLNELPKWQRMLNYKFIRKVSGVIVLGPSLKWIFEGMVKDENIFTVPNCVDDNYIMSDREFDNKMNCLSSNGVKHVLYLSNFIASKGYREVLKMALLEKRQQHRNYHFDFAGAFFDKKEENFFWNFIKKNKIENLVTYHGVVEGKMKMELLKKSSVFCLLSRYSKEGQPISIIEAMANGMIVISTNHAGIGDLVANELNGIVVEKEDIDVNKIFFKLKSLTDENYSSIAYTNRCLALNKYTQNRYLGNMRRIFRIC